MAQLIEDYVPNYSKIDRIAWVDWAKALAILMMVLGHGTAPDIIIKYVYAFHMPAFFIISGYLYRPKPFLKVLKSFGIPILFFGFINYLFALVIDYKAGIPFSFNLETLLLIPLSFPGFWFIRTLFLARVLSGDLISKHHQFVIRSLFVVAVISIICVETGMISGLPNWIYDLFYSYPFFAIGFLLKKIEYKVEQKPILIIVESIIFLIVPFLFEKFDLGEHHFGPTYFLFLVLSVSSSLLFFSICNKLPIFKVITLLSEGTLVVLGIHKILLKLLYQVFKYLPFEWFLSLSSITYISWKLIEFCKKKSPFLLGK